VGSVKSSHIIQSYNLCSTNATPFNLLKPSSRRSTHIIYISQRCCRLDFGSKPIERQLILSAQFLQNELPVRLAHRVAELENLPYGLSGKPHVLKVRDWYVESFKELRSFTKIRDVSDEQQFTGLLKHIYTRHRNVVPVMAMGVAGSCVNFL
jgi:hypothetical protein